MFFTELGTTAIVFFLALLCFMTLLKPFRAKSKRKTWLP